MSSVCEEHHLQQAELLIVVLHLWMKRLTGIIVGQCQPLNDTFKAVTKVIVT